MIDRNKILDFIRKRGYVLPLDLSAEVKKDSIITGAILSDLAASKLVNISNTKVGGSPVYYVKEQNYKLQDLYKYLNEKDKRAYDLLKQKKVLRDIELTPLLRVSLRQIKDFAKPVEVNIGNQVEIFWKWFLTNAKEAEELIKAYFMSPEEKAQGLAKEKSKEKIEPSELTIDTKPNLKISTEPTQPDLTVSTNDKKPNSTVSFEQTRPDTKHRNQDHNRDKSMVDDDEFIQPRMVDQRKDETTVQIKGTDIKKEKAQLDQEKDFENNKTQLNKKRETQLKTNKKELDKQETLVPVIEPEGDKLHNKTKKFFNDKHIIVLKIDVIRKNSEIDYIIKVPSEIGEIKYFCKSKDKKRSNDGDLASAYVKGQVTKLPVLYLTTGEISKKAKEMLNNEFDNLIVKNVSFIS